MSNFFGFLLGVILAVVGRSQAHFLSCCNYRAIRGESNVIRLRRRCRSERVGAACLSGLVFCGV